MVTFSVSNHAPHTFSPFDIQPPLTGNSTTGEHGYECTAVLEKLATNHLFTPINPQHPATITVTDSGSTIDLDAAALAQHLALAITSDSLLANHQDHNRDMMDLLSQLTHHVGFDRRFIVDQLFVSQALKTHRLPAPANNVIYTVANDVIPSAKDILSITAKMNNPLTATTRAPVTTDEVHAAYDVFFASLASVFSPALMVQCSSTMPNLLNLLTTSLLRQPRCTLHQLSPPTPSISSNQCVTSPLMTSLQSFYCAKMNMTQLMIIHSLAHSSRYCIPGYITITVTHKPTIMHQPAL